MPRLVRTVFANIPHHITQQGKKGKKGTLPFFWSKAQDEVLRELCAKGPSTACQTALNESAWYVNRGVNKSAPGKGDVTL